MADRLVANPPTQQDSIVAALEALAFLGRDEDIVRLAEGATDDQVVDAGSRAVPLHLLAYAPRRLGDRKSAKASPLCSTRNAAELGTTDPGKLTWVAEIGDPVSAVPALKPTKPANWVDGAALCDTD